MSSYNRQLRPARGVAGRHHAAAHAPTVAGGHALGGEAQGAAAPMGVDAVHGAHQRRVAAVGLEQRALGVAGVAEVEQHHAGLLVGVAGLVEAAQAHERRAHQQARVVGGLGQRHGEAALVLRVVFLEGVGADVDLHGAGARALPPELLGGAADVGGDGLFQPGEVIHVGAEGARAHDLLLVRRFLLELDAGRAVELGDGALEHHRELAPQPFRVGLAQGFHVADAERLQARRAAVADTPHLADVDAFQQGVGFCGGEGGEVADAAELGAFLGGVVGELGQRLGGAETDADGQAEPLPHAGADLLPVGGEIVAREAVHAEEALVDAVDLLVGRETAEHGHHARAHVAVERVVGGFRDDAVLAGELAQLEPGHAHLHAERLHLLASGYDAAVVVGEHDDGTALQLRVEDAFAGDVEVVAVD